MRSPKTYQLTIADINKLFAVLKEKYAIYAPVRIPSGGRYSGQDSILYREVERYEEIEFRERSTYAMKEVITPITQTLFYFTDDEFRESKLEDSRDLLVFGRAGDINAIKIQDQIYYENGGVADPFYQRRREKVKFALIECQEQFDGCFCCSTGSNVTDMHSIAFSFGEDGAYIEVKDDCFSKYFDGCGETDYEITFPAENKLKVDFPVIDNLDLANKLKSHGMNSTPDVLPAEPVPWPAAPVPVLKPPILFIHRTERPEKEGEPAPPVWWTALTAWPEAPVSVIKFPKNTAIRYYIKYTDITRDFIPARCVWAAAGVRQGVRS